MGRPLAEEAWVTRSSLGRTIIGKDSVKELKLSPNTFQFKILLLMHIKLYFSRPSTRPAGMAYVRATRSATVEHLKYACDSHSPLYILSSIKRILIEMKHSSQKNLFGQLGIDKKYMNGSHLEGEQRTPHLCHPTLFLTKIPQKI